MAVSIQASDNQTGSSVTSLTSSSFTWASGDLFAVIVLWTDGAASISSVTTTGSNLSFADSGAGSGNRSNQWAQVYVGTVTGGSSGTITANMSETTDYMGLYTVQLRGSALAQDGSGSYGAKTATPSFTVTTSNADAMVIGGWSVRLSTITPGSGYTELYEDNPHFSTYLQVQHQTFTGTGAQTFDATIGNNNVAGAAIGVYDSGGTGYTLTADSGSFTLAGQDVSLLAGRLLDAASGTYTLTGQDVGLLRGLLLAADSGGFTLTGQDVGLLASRLLGADSGSFTLAGQDVTLTYNPLTGYTLTADSGSFTLTGQDVSLLASRLLGAGSGSFTLTGQDVGLLASRLLSAASGAFTLTGQDVTLTYSGAGAPDYTLTAGSGSFALTGQDVSLLVGRLLTADSASFTLTGQDTALLRGYLLGAGSGSFTLAGQDVTLLASRILSAASGSFDLAGQNVTLVYSAAPTAVTPGARTFEIPEEVRVFIIPADDRVYVIAQDARTYTIED
jgi:hypothetical protein